MREDRAKGPPASDGASFAAKFTGSAVTDPERSGARLYNGPHPYIESEKCVLISDIAMWIRCLAGDHPAPTETP